MQQITLGNGSAAEWAAANPVLPAGEQGLETDTRKVKTGDGATAWVALPYSGVNLSAGTFADARTALSLDQLYASTSTATTIVRPETYGAVGDGTTDDGPAWTDAIAAAAILGKQGAPATVRGQEGAVYRIRTTIIPKANVTCDMRGVQMRGGITGSGSITSTAPAVPASSDVAGQVAGGCFTEAPGVATLTGMRFLGGRFTGFRYVFVSASTAWPHVIFEDCVFENCNIGFFAYQASQEARMLNCYSTGSQAGTTFVGAATCFAADNPYSGADNFFCDGFLYDNAGSGRDRSTSNPVFDDWFSAAIMRPDTPSTVINGTRTFPFTGDHLKPSGRNIYIPSRNNRLIFGTTIRRAASQACALGVALISNPSTASISDVRGEEMFIPGPKSMINVLCWNGTAPTGVFRNIDANFVTHEARAAIEVTGIGVSAGRMIAESIDGPIVGADFFLGSQAPLPDSGARVISADYTATSFDRTIFATGGASGVTVTIPRPIAGLTVEIVKLDGGVGPVQVVPGGGTIDGSSALVLLGQHQAVSLQGNGTDWVRISRAADGAYTPSAGQYEFQPMWVTGHSWQAADVNATPGTRWYQRVMSRFRMGTATNMAASGRTVGDISLLTLSGATSWTPRTKALVGVTCTINDITIFGAGAPVQRGYQYAWRALLSQLTANAAIAANTSQFAYSAGWTPETVVRDSTGGAGANSTGGTRWKTTTANSFVEHTFTGDACDLFFIARAAGAGLITVTSGGTTLGALDLTAATAQDCPAIFTVRGLGAGPHTVRATLTSGASMTIDSARIPSTAPPPGVVIGEPQVIASAPPGGGDYNAARRTLLNLLAPIVADYPTFRFVDMDSTGLWSTSMLTADGKHPTDPGCAAVATAAVTALMALPYQVGLNVLADPYPAVYAPPAAPVIGAGGQDGTGLAYGTVTGVQVTTTNTTATLTWTASSLPSLTDYAVQYRTSTGPGTWTDWAHSASTATTTTVTGLTTTTSYDFRIAAVAGGTTYPYSVPVTGITVQALADNFNRTDSASAGSTSTGSVAWSIIGTGTWGPASNAMAVKSGTGVTLLVADCASANGSIQATLSGLVGLDQVGLTMRAASTSTYLYVLAQYTSSKSGWSIIKRVASATTVLAFREDITPANGDIVKMVCSGTAIQLWVNGVMILSATAADSALQTVSTHGLLGRFDTFPGARWDDWSYTPSA